MVKTFMSKIIYFHEPEAVGIPEYTIVNISKVE